MLGNFEATHPFTFSKQSGHAKVITTLGPPGWVGLALHRDGEGSDFGPGYGHVLGHMKPKQARRFALDVLRAADAAEADAKAGGGE